MAFTLSSLIPWAKKSAAEPIYGELYKETFGLQSAKSGQSVNWKTALQVSTFFACARVIAEGIAQVPFKLYKSKPDGKGSDLAKDHPLYKIISLKPNDYQTSFELREQIGLHLAVKFNAYIFINRGGLRGEIVELLPFEPDQVRVVRDGWERSFEVYVGKGKIIKVPSSDMWHIRGPSWNGVIGMDAIKMAREAIGMALATEEHAARMFANGARVGGVLSADSPLSKEQREDLKEAWEQSYAGNVNAYQTAILYGGLKYQPMAQTGVDSQHLEQRRFQVEEICRGARVMPIMIGHNDKSSTYASAEQMFLAHIVHTMMPWFERIEQSATVNLLTQQEISQGYYPKFKVNALMRGTFKDRADYYTKLYAVAGINPNEIRDLEDMNPYEGGDQYRAPMNFEQVNNDNQTDRGTDNADSDSAS